MEEGKQKKPLKKKKKEERFSYKNDPKFYPIDTRITIEPRFNQMFDESFPILSISRNI
jgi:hypothetical protein